MARFAALVFFSSLASLVNHGLHCYPGSLNSDEFLEGGDSLQCRGVLLTSGSLRLFGFIILAGYSFVRVARRSHALGYHLGKNRTSHLSIRTNRW